MVALPIVASMVAPLAIQANSLCMVANPAAACLCDDGMTSVQGQACVSTTAGGLPCADPNCNCVASNSGNAMGTCLP